MKVTIIVYGRFHSFYYAKNLQDQGKLNKVISSMPYSIARKYGIHRQNYIGLPMFEVVKIFFYRVLKSKMPDMLNARLFTSIAKMFIPRTSDVIISVVGGCAYEIFRSARFANAIKIIDRVSTHSVENITLKSKAYSYAGIPWEQYPGELYVEREVEEYKMADIILVPSDFVKATFTKHKVEPEKVHVLPYIVGDKKFRELGNIPRIRKRILFVGSLSHRKGILVLRDAMFKLQGISDIVCHVVGPNIEDKIDIESFPKNMKYLGVLGGDKLQKQFMEATVLVLPSFEEGLAYVLTEANQLGLRIVATENSGVKNLELRKGMNPYIVEPGNFEDLSRKLLSAINDKCDFPVEVTSSSNNQNRNWEDYTNELLEIIDEIKN